MCLVVCVVAKVIWNSKADVNLVTCFPGPYGALSEVTNTTGKGCYEENITGRDENFLVGDVVIGKLAIN